MAETINCRICGKKSPQLFDTLVLNKYTVKYYRCNKCSAIITENPYWLEEAYKEPISEYDTGIVARNINISERIAIILKRHFDKNQIFLDYGGGYGLFVRLMRDKGFNFFRYDKYEQNLFARYFDYTDLGMNPKFAMATSFELFEHFVNPIEEIERIFSYSDNIIFSTELIPKKTIRNANDWWYFVPVEGQHITFYSLVTLQWIAKHFGAKLISDGKSLHCFSKDERKINLTPTSILMKLIYYKLKTIFKPNKETDISFLNDFNYILKRKMNGI